ncbi:fimbria/pilus outer membrane usher protein [Serratia fonticola]|uniref:fimbria/pilus outer membrane usher protein n=1 Tax=Serratia fonticola TaxID=47917 RepID=UPI0009D72517|nr:fimbria/pilus outer membrane usher protein [Serratia fonticola]
MNNKNYIHRLLRVSKWGYLITAQLTLLASVSFDAQAQDYFNPALLEIDNSHQGSADLSVFEDSNMQIPGTYRVDIYLNKERQSTSDVEFKASKDKEGKESLQPCLSVEQLQAMGVRTELFTNISDVENQCANLGAIPQASAEFRFSAQQLLLSVPQAAMSQKARGYVPEEQWDNGISAFLLNYSLKGATASTNNANSSSQFANLRPGINIGPWRLRNYTTWQRDNSGQDKWNTVYSYAQRDVIALKSRLILGDSTSPSDVFDSVPFRGAQMASDDDMIPDSLKGYAPVVRGVARTNAQVVIRQNGYVIYQSFVAPGAFEINDMYPTGSSGDLFVTIKEADGSEQQLVIPFASLPVLQREGYFKYTLTGGQYRSYDSKVAQTPFSQLTGIYGLPHGLTAYGGVQFANNYQSVAIGLGKNLGRFGALSTDITHTRSTQQDQPDESGQSLRIRYSKNIVQTGTNLAIAGYRYSTDGYYSLQEVMDTYRNEGVQSQMERRRNRSEVTLSQNLWEGAGALSLSWVSEDYWNNKRTMRSIGTGYNNSWNGINYGFSYNYNEDSVASGNNRGNSGRTYERDQVFSFNVSVPLNRWMGNSYATYSMSTSQKNATTNTVGLSGTALTNNNLNWSMQQGHVNQGGGSTTNLNADYRGTYGQINAGYAYEPNSQRLSYGLQGGIVAHEDGVTFGQQLGETAVLVKAQGAAGVSVGNQAGVKTDGRGYAIVPYGTPYRKNQVQLNTETLPYEVDIVQNTQSVVPTRGALVRATFEANVGQRAMMTVLRKDGTPVPFGATVTNQAQKTEQGFIVGDNGQVYLTGLAERGVVNVQWGNGTEQKCQVSYSLTKKAQNTMNVPELSGQCK